MRTLHNVGQHERLLARGQYRLFRSGRDTGRLEHWNLHRLPDGSTALRADVDGRDATDPTAGVESVLVHLLLDPEGQADRLHVRLHSAVQKAEAQLTFFPGYAMVNRFIDGRALPRSEMELPGEVVVVAPCLSSSAARAYDERQGGRQIVRLLDLTLDSSAGAGDLLAPSVRDFSLDFEGPETVELEGLGRFEARHMVEDDAADARLDLHDVLLTRNLRHSDLEAKLTQYARFGEQEV